MFFNVDAHVFYSNLWGIQVRGAVLNNPTAATVVGVVLFLFCYFFFCLCSLGYHPAHKSIHGDLFLLTNAQLFLTKIIPSSFCLWGLPFFYISFFTSYPVTGCVAGWLAHSILLSFSFSYSSFFLFFYFFNMPGRPT